MRVGSSGKNCRTRRGQIAIVVHVSKTSKTFCLSKTSRMEIVRITSPKSCGRDRIMAIVASSSYRLSKENDSGESDLITLICWSTLLIKLSRDSFSSF